MLRGLGLKEGAGLHGCLHTYFCSLASGSSSIPFQPLKCGEKSALPSMFKYISAWRLLGHGHFPATSHPIPAPPHPTLSKGHSVLSQGWCCFRQSDQAGPQSSSQAWRCFFISSPSAQYSIVLSQYLWIHESCGLLSFSGSPAEFGMKGK